MNPLELKAQGLRTYDTLSLEYPAGLVALSGVNGAGKSTLVDAIDVALFGPEGRTLAGYLTDDGSQDHLSLLLTFEHQGDTFRVRRTFDSRGRGQAKLDLERSRLRRDGSGEGGWEPLTTESAAATQEKIESLLGLSRETFRASSFLKQGDSAAFTEVAPAKRKQILAEVLQLGEWETWLERARTERRGVELEARSIADALERFESELGERAGVALLREQALEQSAIVKVGLEETLVALAKTRELLADARANEEKRADAVEAVRRADKERAELTSAILERQAVLAALDSRLATRAGLEQQAACRSWLEEEQETLRLAEEKFREQRHLLSERADYGKESERLLAEALTLERRAELVVAGVGSEHCDRCGQVLGEEAAKKAAESLRDEAREIVRRSDEIGERIEVLNTSIGELLLEPDRTRAAEIPGELERARGAERQLAALDEAADRRTDVERGLSRLNAGLPERDLALAEARAQLEALGPHDPSVLVDLQDSVVEGEREEQGLRYQLAEHERAVARADERLERLEKIAAEANGSRDRRDALHAELDLLANLERACGSNGVPALILENSAIPQIETEANRILLALGTTYRVELRTQREKKTGGLSDTLDVVIATDHGERAYETFSGGERTRLNLALRIALARLLAHRRGAESRLLVIDEPSYLDTKGLAALVEVLRDLEGRGEFSKVILISHLAELRDSFDTSLLVVRENGRSRIIA